MTGQAVYAFRMAKRPTDPNQHAKFILDQITGQVQPSADGSGKNPFAQALGRLGGLKGGHARAASMTAAKRKAIAQAAAKSRWKGHKKAKKAAK